VNSDTPVNVDYAVDVPVGDFTMRPYFSRLALKAGPIGFDYYRK